VLPNFFFKCQKWHGKMAMAKMYKNGNFYTPKAVSTKNELCKNVSAVC